MFFLIESKTKIISKNIEFCEFNKLINFEIFSKLDCMIIIIDI